MGTAGSAGPATDAVAGDAKGETRESRGTGTEKHAKRERERERGPKSKTHLPES
jgi:hypothetical protein